ncbi:unnamed protein product [Cylicocyclus nassatus]|uniref:Uncharacterized protein n=1 Tax=Cylicocyclus nassatus TaxID=53992 RepID=A0AA36H058_CYLNA|nr:unnamed protein product [Cylicocyclus nassatus]
MASLKFLFLTLLAFMFICSTSVQGLRHGMHHRPGRPGPHHRPRPGWIGCLPCCQRNEVVREEMTKSRLFDQCRNDALVCSQFLHDSNAAAESPSQQNLNFLCIRCSIKVVYRRVGNQLLETKS